MLPPAFTSTLVNLLSFWGLWDLYQPTTTPATAHPSHVHADQTRLSFELRHLHAVSPAARVVLADVPRAPAHLYSTSDHHDRNYHEVQTRPLTSFRPTSLDAYSQARLRSVRRDQSHAVQWEEDEILGPDVESRETLLTLAKMTNNAYIEPEDPQWYDLGGDWNDTYPVGWEPDADGFRGYVFATPDNSTVVLSIKGTSSGLFGGGGPTQKKDKTNDNLLFSCCCASVGFSWTPVCGCHRGGWKCDNDCLEDAMVEDSLFYPIGTNLYNNISYIYPTSNIWIIGHSLGGSLAALLGTTFGAPVVTFEAPGEKMAAGRMHLPSPPSTQHVTHVYHTADPIPMGTCNGVFSSCAIGGYAMESKCHLGRTILYDTVSNLSWPVDVRTHGIVNIIERLLGEPWAPSVEAGREVPVAKAEDDCVECYSWEFGDFPK
ncbi:alpha/beta-hydrolase [Athelia psychrophila]|uniref:triacylglycerol lipase n=1 Tax=Athelia psychrophila TaxID=1759441 RepID=A0A166UJV3_9AGAM|nr:alpha/beta-hydrolase [Fibularhizoctonia sp. CBS 109695]